MIAAANAVSCWFNWEGTLSLQIQQHPFSNAEQFRMWLSQWGLARRVKLKPPSRTSRGDFTECTPPNHSPLIWRVASCRQEPDLDKSASSSPILMLPFDERVAGLYRIGLMTCAAS